MLELFHVDMPLVPEPHFTCCLIYIEFYQHERLLSCEM